MNAAIARLADPTIHLAAYGGVVFPLALIIESPIIMLLSAATALSKDEDSYQKIWRFMMVSGAILTGLHILLAFTPLYYPLVARPMGVPAEIVEPARLGLMIMLPWTWAIAYRRFNQGTLIRFGNSRAVGIGTIVRLTANLTVLVSGYLLARGPLAGQLPGIAVGTSAIAAGVMSEALYAGLAVRPVRYNQVRYAPAAQPGLTWNSFFAFYIPLALTSLLSLIVNPLGSAAISRMPEALNSLAVWSGVTGLAFLLRSPGIAYNEVVVAMMDEHGSYASLKRFALILLATTSAALLLILVTPLANLWFSGIMGLPAELSRLARLGLWWTLPMPALIALQSWYQGTILYGRATRGVTESVVIYLAVIGGVLASGVIYGRVTGLYVGLAAMSLSTAAQTAWLWYRARPVLKQVKQRDSNQ